MRKTILFLILVLALFFRFNHLNWDQNHHLHPDERFLTMVTLAMRLPQSFEEYFHQQKSLLNPSNIGFNFYVYGIFPLVLTKSLAVNLGMDNYDQIALLGRFLSAFVDFLTVVLVYKATKLLIGGFKSVSPFTLHFIPLFSAFFYGVSVYPIQSAHFFTTDTFLNFFMFGSFYFVLKAIKHNRLTLYLFFSSLFFSLALASKISALYILPLNLGILFLTKTVFIKDCLFKRQSLFKILGAIFFGGLYLIVCYLFLRLFNPYYFENPSFFDFTLNNNFYQSIKLLKTFTAKEAWYPPSVQWIEKPWYGLLLTTFLVGLGPVNFIICFAGLVYVLINSKFKMKISKLKLKIKNYHLIIFLIIVWVLGYFVYQSSQFVKSIRYTIYLYPFFAIFGGWGIFVILSLFQNLSNKILKQVQHNKLVRFRKKFRITYFLYFTRHVTRYTLYVILLIWPSLFSTIYFHPHTRIEASEWIYKNLKNGSFILGEHWDDPLPLSLEKNFGKFFQVELLPVFDPDIPEKWQKIEELLKKADYYVLSSNRGWGSIPTVPSRYPLMSQYYQALLNDDCVKQKKLVGVCYKKIKTFEPYYYKFIKYPDSWVEEAFTVYDHPTVLVYKKI